MGRSKVRKADRLYFKERNTGEIFGNLKEKHGLPRRKTTASTAWSPPQSHTYPTQSGVRTRKPHPHRGRKIPSIYTLKQKNKRLKKPDPSGSYKQRAESSRQRKDVHAGNRTGQIPNPWQSSDDETIRHGGRDATPETKPGIYGEGEGGDTRQCRV